jgi:uncharacterized protein YegP (UPF0339 family)
MLSVKAVSAPHFFKECVMAAKYVLKKAKNGKFFFNLQASNGQPILTSEMYDAVQNALDGIASVRKNGVVETSFDKLVAKDGSPYFTLKAGNGHIVGHSEMYSSVAARDNGVASVMKNAADAVLDDQSAAS